MMETPKASALPVIVLHQSSSGQGVAGGLPKAPAPQVVDKPSRMTQAKRAALDALAVLGGNFFEWGAPPYALSKVAERLGVDLSNLAKTMRLLERDGLVVREVVTRDCWNAIAQRHIPRRCVSYWLAASMAQDKARATQWREGAAERAQSALDRFFTR